MGINLQLCLDVCGDFVWSGLRGVAFNGCPIFGNQKLGEVPFDKGRAQAAW